MEGERRCGISLHVMALFFWGNAGNVMALFTTRMDHAGHYGIFLGFGMLLLE